MNTQISTPIKIVAVVGLLLIVGVLGMTKLSGGSTSSATIAPSPVVAHPAPVAKTPATTTPASHAAPAKTPAAPKTKPAVARQAAPAKPHVVAKPHAAAKPKPVPAVAANGLPGSLDELLHIHQVVVVAVYDPEVPTDKLFVGEAQAGAKDAHAGFLAVSVLNERVAGPLTAAAGGGALLPSPGVLIFKEPNALMNVITGFIDRAAVAQAVASAMTAETPNQGTPATTASAAPVASVTPVPAPATTTGP